MDIDSGRDVRIGVLGAARITREALVKPARSIDGVTVHALAARDHSRAARAAERDGIPVVHRSYQEMLDDPSLDAVYIPLPASLHAQWTIAALAAGKHVLTEKPFAANADEAAIVAEHAASTPCVVMEAYHTGSHPNTARLREIVQSGELGEIRHAVATFHAPVPPGRDIRWNLDLAGGALLDIGYYPVRLLQDILPSAPTTPTHVLGATARGRAGIDRTLTARLTIDGIPASVDCGMWSTRLVDARLIVVGSRGTLRMWMPYHPQIGRLRVAAGRTRRAEPVSRRTSYSYQLEAFRDAIRRSDAVRTDAAAATRHLNLLDTIYRRAGMDPRHGTLTPKASAS